VPRLAPEECVERRRVDGEYGHEGLAAGRHGRLREAGPVAEAEDAARDGHGDDEDAEGEEEEDDEFSGEEVTDGDLLAGYPGAYGSAGPGKDNESIGDSKEK
jgi:hypothetical protein